MSHDQINTTADKRDSFDPIAYINTPRWNMVSPGLTRIAELLEGLGNPQNRLRFVHVAGTNGKGSTCAMVAQILQEAGYTVGLFTSPYLIHFEERIRINGVPISLERLREVTIAVREVAETMADHPTEFELMTAVAFLYFAEEACDIVVAEVGLGGRLDSTNVISTVEVSAIANISYDHKALLGNTLAEIAGEKVGIIKQGIKVVSASQPQEAWQVIAQRAQDLSAPLACVDLQALSGTNESFVYKGRHHLSLTLAARYQMNNAALALEVIDVLRDSGWHISEEAIYQGLKNTVWHGRFEVLRTNPTFIIDGAHNSEGVDALVDSLQSFYDQKIIFILGVMEDKDYPEMLEKILPLGKAFIAVQPNNPRALSVYKLARSIRFTGQDLLGCSACIRPYEAKTIEDGVRQALSLAEENDVICACGSLYYLGDVVAALDTLDPKHS